MSEYHWAWRVLEITTRQEPEGTVNQSRTVEVLMPHRVPVGDGDDLLSIWSRVERARDGALYVGGERMVDLRAYWHALGEALAALDAWLDTPAGRRALGRGEADA